MGPRQLGLRKTRGLAHHGCDFFVGVALDIVQPDNGSRRLGEALESRLEVHTEVMVFPDPPDDLVVQLVGLPVLVPPETHECLAGSDGPNPPPEASLFPVAA